MKRKQPCSPAPSPIRRSCVPSSPSPSAAQEGGGGGGGKEVKRKRGTKIGMRSVIREACVKGDVPRLCSCDLEGQVEEDTGYTPLHLTLHNGRVHATYVLLQMYNFAYMPDEKGVTPFELCMDRCADNEGLADAWFPELMTARPSTWLPLFLRHPKWPSLLKYTDLKAVASSFPAIRSLCHAIHALSPSTRGDTGSTNKENVRKTFVGVLFPEREQFRLWDHFEVDDVVCQVLWDWDHTKSLCPPRGPLPPLSDVLANCAEDEPITVEERCRIFTRMIPYISDHVVFCTHFLGLLCIHNVELFKVYLSTAPKEQTRKVWRPFMDRVPSLIDRAGLFSWILDNSPVTFDPVQLVPVVRQAVVEFDTKLLTKALSSLEPDNTPAPVAAFFSDLLATSWKIWKRLRDYGDTPDKMMSIVRILVLRGFCKVADMPFTFWAYATEVCTWLAKEKGPFANWKNVRLHIDSLFDAVRFEAIADKDWTTLFPIPDLEKEKHKVANLVFGRVFHIFTCGRESEERRARLISSMWPRLKAFLLRLWYTPARSMWYAWVLRSPHACSAGSSSCSARVRALTEGTEGAKHPIKNLHPDWARRVLSFASSRPLTCFKGSIEDRNCGPPVFATLLASPVWREMRLLGFSLTRCFIGETQRQQLIQQYGAMLGWEPPSCPNKKQRCDCITMARLLHHEVCVKWYKRQ